jgi:hypothetical protein
MSHPGQDFYTSFYQLPAEPLFRKSAPSSVKGSTVNHPTEMLLAEKVKSCHP